MIPDCATILFVTPFADGILERSTFSLVYFLLAFQRTLWFNEENKSQGCSQSCMKCILLPVGITTSHGRKSIEENTAFEEIKLRILRASYWKLCISFSNHIKYIPYINEAKSSKYRIFNKHAPTKTTQCGGTNKIRYWLYIEQNDAWPTLTTF